MTSGDEKACVNHHHGGHGPGGGAAADGGLRLVLGLLGGCDKPAPVEEAALCGRAGGGG